MKTSNIKEINGLVVLEPRVHEDDRGFFLESYNEEQFNEIIGQNVNFVQDNQSKSNEGVLRGLHYQAPPFDQGKLIRVLNGEIYDIVLDLRKKSDSFGKWFGIHLTSENFKQLWIPAGFAHGFNTLSHTAVVAYKTSNYYSKSHERCIIWNDSTLSIDWKVRKGPYLSDKDQLGVKFKDAEYFNF